MKQVYSNCLLVRVPKILLFSFLFLALSYASVGQIYTTQLSGPAEAPPNASPGTGSGKVTINGNSMRVQTSFSGLLGNTTVAHIHAPTASPNTGTAGVTTTVPTFTGFPAGVQAGSYDNTFDMSLASSYNPAFLAANGGTPLSAFAALKTALNDGKAYLNIHSTMFPGGEIRGFFVACPTINVSIPDAFALPQGALANTVYPAYQPANSLTLTANVSGGTGPYNYEWSTGATSASIKVSPIITTQYAVTAKDQNGCAGTASKIVNVVNIADGKKGHKIFICHKGNSLSIASPAVAAHLKHGDMLGSCTITSQSGTLRRIVMEEAAGHLSLQALPNPTKSYFNLQISSEEGTNMQVRVYDVFGRIIETKNSLPSNHVLRFGMEYKPGVYLVEVVQGSERQTLRLMKQ